MVRCGGVWERKTIRFVNRLNVECERKKYVKDDFRARGSIDRKTGTVITIFKKH